MATLRILLCFIPEFPHLFLPQAAQRFLRGKSANFRPSLLPELSNGAGNPAGVCGG